MHIYLLLVLTLHYREHQNDQDNKWIVKEEKMINQKDQTHLPPYVFGMLCYVIRLSLHIAINILIFLQFSILVEFDLKEELIYFY